MKSFKIVFIITLILLGSIVSVNANNLEIKVDDSQKFNSVLGPFFI